MLLNWIKTFEKILPMRKHTSRLNALILKYLVMNYWPATSTELLAATGGELLTAPSDVLLILPPESQPSRNVFLCCFSRLPWVICHAYIFLATRFQCGQYQVCCTTTPAFYVAQLSSLCWLVTSNGRRWSSWQDPGRSIHNVQAPWVTKQALEERSE